MAHIRVLHDPIGETLPVYWKEPSPDQVCEETGDGVILMKNSKTGEVVGFARLSYRSDLQTQVVTVETITTIA